MKVRIYQINRERDKHDLLFRSYYEATDGRTNQIDAEIYDCVFEGEIDTNSVEGVYMTFNICPPNGYSGRSLSVSDVIEVCEANPEDAAILGYWYCDNVGWEKIVFEGGKAGCRS